MENQKTVTAKATSTEVLEGSRNVELKGLQSAKDHFEALLTAVDAIKHMVETQLKFVQNDIDNLTHHEKIS